MLKYLLPVLIVLLATPAEAQWRRGGYGYGHHGGYGYRGGGGFGAAAGGAVVGGVIGGVIGGLMRPAAPAPVPAPQYYQQAPAVDPIAYCMQRFRSYNPETGVYLGYDRQYHPCP